MDPEQNTNSEQQIEEKRIRRLIEKYKQKTGDFDIVSIGSSGYILQSKLQRPMAGNDWVFFDLDDTLVAYTEVKKRRLELYETYLKKSNINIPSELASNVLEITDKFSRWEEHEGEGKMYHANAHMNVLQWATNLLRNNKVPPEESLSTIRTDLDRIKNQLMEEGEQVKTDPFYFRHSDRRFTLRSAGNMWSKDIEDIFTGSMISPPVYQETMAAAIETGSPRQSVNRTNIGIFTYGDPYFQLLKVLELMEQQPDFPISQIWLSQSPKGDFIVDLAKSGATAKLDLDYLPAELEEYPGEGISGTSGEVLGHENHVIVMMDDNPKELSSILLANSYLREHTGAEFVVVRSKRPETKESRRDWQVNTPYGELDFTSGSLLPQDISNTFLINRFLTTKSRLGPDHPNTKYLEEQMQRRGIKLEVK
jgi:hypothetical protein